MVGRNHSALLSPNGAGMGGEGAGTDYHIENLHRRMSFRGACRPPTPEPPSVFQQIALPPPARGARLGRPAGRGVVIEKQGV